MGEKTPRRAFFVDGMKMVGFGLTIAAIAGDAQMEPDVPENAFHLTARPWKPFALPRSAYLDAIEGVCRFTTRHLDAEGAVIDPFLKREHQYSTPYFAYAVGTLIEAGRAMDLLPVGIRAMDHATTCFANGREGIPDQHGEFFIAPLVGALDLYSRHIADETLTRWRERLRTPLDQVIGSNTNNWRTYAMKGEWLRARASLADRDQALAFIRDAWLHATQRERIANDRWNLYQDHITDPESHAVEAVGRGNLLALIAEGYDGDLKEEIARLVERGTRASLLLQDPSGQCPPNGRTDDHVFNDVLYQLAFEVMAERLWVQGDRQTAGQYRRAAMLAFGSIARWRRSDGEWQGSYYITKNHFDPRDRVGYQTASNYGNYNGAVMLHLAEAYRARQAEIPEQPAPVETGGYVIATDPRFASVAANAGGMQLFANLRGDTQTVYDNYWTPLGVVRFARVGWDSRLGPSDGVRDAHTGRGVSFAPTWFENGEWVRLADMPERYEGTLTTEFTHPLLVHCVIEYRPRSGYAGPIFRHEFILTPDAILARLSSPDAAVFGVTCPLLEDDGARLETVITSHGAMTHYPSPHYPPAHSLSTRSLSAHPVAGRLPSTHFPLDSDEQHFLALHSGATVTAEEPSVRSPYGWLRPVRMTAPGGPIDILIYPRSAAEPTADAVRKSVRLLPSGFSSCLGSVKGTLYTGGTAAGGEGKRIVLNGMGSSEATFSRSCRFLLQHENGKVIAAEADRRVDATIQGRRISLEAYMPVTLLP